MVSQIYPSEFQLSKAYTSGTKVTFLDLRLSISNDIVSTKIYDKRDNFDFEIYVSQLIRFARASAMLLTSSKLAIIVNSETS